MSKAHGGQFAQASAPLAPSKESARRKGARRAQAPERKSWVAVVYRLGGTSLDGASGIPSEVRKVREYLGARIAETVAAPALSLSRKASGGKRKRRAFALRQAQWLDYWRIPLPPTEGQRQRALALLARLRDNETSPLIAGVGGPYGIGAQEESDCPYGTRGRVLFSAGGGEVRPGARPSALRRAAFRELEREGFRSLMLYNAFGSIDRAREALALTPWSEIASLFPLQEQWGPRGPIDRLLAPQGWELGDASFTSLVNRFPEYTQYWHFVSSQLATADLLRQFAPSDEADKAYEAAETAFDCLRLWGESRVKPQAVARLKVDMAPPAPPPAPAPMTAEEKRELRRPVEAPTDPAELFRRIRQRHFIAEVMECNRYLIDPRDGSPDCR